MPINLKAWRKARALTQESAAELLGLSWRQYQRIETGRSKASPMLERLIGAMQ